MKFAVSNIAWSYAERLDAYALLRDHGFDGLEIAPGLLFADEADPLEPSKDGVRARLAEMARFGLDPVSMQSLLFGVDGAALFGAPPEVTRLAEGLERAIRLAGRLGLANLVFGSPRQRVIPDGMDRKAVLDRMREVFRPLGDLAAAQGACLALEPNAPAYGTNFMTSFAETLAVVRAVGHPAVTLNFDVGALHMTNCFGDVAVLLAEADGLVSHVHISAPQLAPAPASAEEAGTVLEGLVAIGYGRAVSIEMTATPGAGLAPLTQAVERLHAAAVSRGLIAA